MFADDDEVEEEEDEMTDVSESRRFDAKEAARNARRLSRTRGIILNEKDLFVYLIYPTQDIIFLA